MKFHPTLKAASTAFALLLAASAAQAQNYYSTGFEPVATPDVQNDAFTGNPYSAPVATTTDTLTGQNSWSTNDPIKANTGTNYVGDSNFVGGAANGNNFVFGVNSAYGAALGGVYRNANPTANTPDVVPGAAFSNVLHPVSLTPTISNPVQLNVDFAVTAPNNSGQGFTANDTFGFTLRNSSTNLISVNFAASTTNPGVNDIVTFTAGANTATANGNGIVLNARYHLTVSINPTTGAFTGSVLTLNGTPADTFTGSIGGPLTAAALTQVGATWQLANTAQGTNGGFNGAGDNAIFFDNLSVAIPEPSTYAMMILGFVGLGLVIRARRQQA